jgi:hypothetical protein
MFTSRKLQSIALLSFTLFIALPNFVFAQSAGWTESGTTTTTTDSVGIGHAPVNGKLDVKGAVWIENTSTDHAVRIFPATTGGVHLIDTNFAASGGYLPLRITANSASYINQLYLDTAGKVGIGTNSPSSTLTVAGTVQSTTGGFKFPDGTVQTTATTVLPNGSGNYILSGNLGIGADPGTIPFYVPKTGLNLGGNGYYVDRINNSTGTLGVLIGYDTANGGLISSTGASKGLGFWTHNGSAYGERVRIDAAGNMAIGAIAPNAALHVFRSASALQTKGNETRLLQLGSDSNQNTYGGQFEFRERRYSDAVSGGHALAIYGKTTADASQTANAFLMIIQADGKVGIGNIEPQKTLDVTGDIYASGTISGHNVIANYQDVAEWVPTEHPIPAGTVVVINPQKRNEVLPSARSYDTGVAGVVSENPGLLLGIAADTKSKIATTGRVRVHVDATAHPINAGDLLVTSEKPGVAMASQPIDIAGVKIHRPGTLIGKALEPLQSGEGDILVLLSLQ